jgi:hypothetical protein
MTRTAVGDLLCRFDELAGAPSGWAGRVGSYDAKEPVSRMITVSVPPAFGSVR